MNILLVVRYTIRESTKMIRTMQIMQNGAILRCWMCPVSG